MRRGDRPPIGLAFVWTFAAGAYFALGVVRRDHEPIVAASAFLLCGPISWFVGRP